MDNRLRSSWLEANGQRYEFFLGTNELAALEKITNRGVLGMVASWQDPDKVRIADLRTLIWGGLRKKHPAMTEERAGELIDEIGGPGKALEFIIEATISAFPNRKPDDQPGEGESPTPASPPANGTGTPLQPRG